MVKQFVRRSVFAVVVGVVGVAAVGTAGADDGSGTDICPKGMACNAASNSDSSMAMSSNAVAVAQVMLLMVGMS